MLSTSMAVANRAPAIAWDLWQGPRLSLDELEQLRERRLQRIVRHAFEQVPYYRDLFDSVGLEPGDVRSVDDLRAIPVSSKEAIVAAGPERRWARDSNRKACSVSRTSGSSGQPLSTHIDRREQWTRRLLGLRRLGAAGWRPWDRVCILCDPTQLRSSRFRTHIVPVVLPPERQLELLSRAQPAVIKAWPSSLRVLLHHAGEQLGRAIRPRVVALSGEECPDDLRQSIEAALGAEVFVWYGAGEFGPIASECRYHRGLHIDADQVIVECENQSSPAEPGDLLLTSLHGFRMPYIRYRIGDVGVVDDTPCPCGNPFPRLTGLRGRKDNVIYLAAGKTVSVAAVVNTALRHFPSLRRFCLVQETSDGFIVQVSFFEPPSEDTLRAIEERMSDCLGGGVRLRAQVVDGFDGPSGRKFGNFVSRVGVGSTPR